MPKQVALNPKPQESQLQKNQAARNNTAGLNSPQFNISQLKLIVGLGNVGAEYDHTRHNAGFLFLDYLQQKIDKGAHWKQEQKLKANRLKLIAGGLELVIAKPGTMMNASGEAVQALCQFYKLPPEQILVVHDDLDLAIGNWKLQFAREPKEHNGILSINQRLGTTHYWRLRLGIDDRKLEAGNRKPTGTGQDYVLGRFSEDELVSLYEVFDQVLQEIWPHM